MVIWCCSLLCTEGQIFFQLEFMPSLNQKEDVTKKQASMQFKRHRLKLIEAPKQDRCVYKIKSFIFLKTDVEIG